MGNLLQTVLILLLALAIAAVILLSGCVSESGNASPPAAGGAQPGKFQEGQYAQQGMDGALSCDFARGSRPSGMPPQ
jgi:hypothetical protein